MATMDVMYGLGAGVGALSSGLVYEAALGVGGSPELAFALPCCAFAALAALLVPLVACTFPGDNGDGSDGDVGSEEQQEDEEEEENSRK